MSKHDVVQKWVVTCVLVLVAVLIGMLCLFVWRLSEVAREIERSISAMSADVQEVTQVAAELARQVEELSERVEGQVDELSAQLDSKDEELAAMWEEAASLAKTWQQEDAEVDHNVEEEINHLLAYIDQPGLKFEQSGKSVTPSWLGFKLARKREIYGAAVTSAEDFIENVASKTVAGNSYYVIDEDGEKEELGRWLLDELHRYRSEKTADKPAESPTASNE